MEVEKRTRRQDSTGGSGSKATKSTSSDHGGDAVEFVEGTLWVPDKDGRLTREEKGRVAGLDAVVEHRSQTLAALGATADPLNETSHAILRYLRLAAQLSQEGQESDSFSASSLPTAAEQHDAASAPKVRSASSFYSQDLAQFDEFTRARAEVAKLLDQLFPIFHSRDALLAEEVPQDTPVRQVAWEDAVAQAEGQANAAPSTTDALGDMGVYGGGGTELTAMTTAPQPEGEQTGGAQADADKQHRLTTPPIPLRTHFLERNEPILLVGEAKERAAHDVFLHGRHDDYDNSANEPAWQELHTKAAHLDHLVQSSCPPNERPAISLPDVLHQAHDQMAEVLRDVRQRITAQDPTTAIPGGAHTRTTSAAPDSAAAPAAAEAGGLLDALRVTGQGCEFHAVDPPAMPLPTLEYLRGRDARDVVVDQICSDHNGLRFVRLVCVGNAPGDAGASGSGDGVAPASETGDAAVAADAATAALQVAGANAAAGGGAHGGSTGGAKALAQEHKQVDSNAAMLQRLSFSPIDSQTTMEVSFDTQAVFWFARRLFGVGRGAPRHNIVAPASLLSVFSQKGPVCFNVTPAYSVSLLDFLHDPETAPHVSRDDVARLAVASMLLLIDDASGQGVTVPSKPPADAGGTFALHNISLFRNPVEQLGDDTVVLGWRSPLWCCDWLLDMPVPPDMRRRVASAAPACVLLRWLGDMQMARDEVDNLAHQDALPPGTDVFAQSIRPGVMIRVHRAFVRLHTILNSDDHLTIGDLLHRLYPVCSQFYEKHRVAARGDVKKTFMRMQRFDYISPVIPSTSDIDGTSRLLHLENVLEQPIPHLAKIPFAASSRATANKRAQIFSLVDAVRELLHAPCLDEPGHPLARYSDPCKLELVLHLSAEFPELDRTSLPSYWNDPAFFHALLRVSSSAMCITPHAIWLFRDYINVSIGGTTPLHQVIRCFSGDLDLVQRQIDYMVRVGADVDGPDRKGMTPVDVCAENHPEIFLQLIGLGAHGGSRTVMLSKFYFKLLESNANDNAPLVAAMKALIERNRQLNWTVSLRQILPPMPGDTLVGIRGETVSDRCLREPFFSQLFKNNSFTPRVPRVSGRRSVGAIECGEHWISFKLRPEFPGVEFVVGHLSRSLFGDWIAPYVELLRVQETLPILASSGVSGVTLRHVMEKSPKLLSYLDFQYVSMAILNAMIVSPEDGKPSDYVVEPIEDGKYRIVAADNERCFCPTASSEQLVEPYVTPTSRAARKVAPYMRPKCVLFCLEQMLRPVDPEVRDHVLSLDMCVLVRKWLAKAVLVNTSHRALFSQEEAAEMLKHDEPTVVGVPMAKSLPVQLLNKLQRLQRTLSTTPNASHLDILRQLEPTMADRYARVLLGTRASVFSSSPGMSPAPRPSASASASSSSSSSSSSTSSMHGSSSFSGGSGGGSGTVFTTPYERFLAVDKPLFHEALDHSLRSAISTEEFVAAYGIKDVKLVPQLTLPGLDNCPETSRRHVDHAFEQLMRRDQLQRTLQNLEQDPDALGRLLSAVEQERWLESLDFAMLGDEAQEALLAVVSGLVLQQVVIRNSRVLRDVVVLSKLNLRHVTRLDLSGNSQLNVSSRVAHHLATQCPRLAHLTLSNLSMSQFVVRRRGHPFPALKVFDLSNCSHLALINFSAPVLHQLILDDCTSMNVIEISTPQLIKLSMVNCRPEKAHTESMEDHHLELSSDTDTPLSSLQRGVQWAKTRFSFKRTRRTDDAHGSDGVEETGSGSGDTGSGNSGEDRIQVSRAAMGFWMKHVVNASHEGPALAALSPALHKQAVKLTKSGLPSSLRGDIWLRVTGGHTLQEADSALYTEALERRFGQSTPSMLELTRSFFGHFFDLRRIGLDHRQQVAAGRVLCCLAQEYSDTPYCPWLPTIVACCVTCMEEQEVFMTGSALLTREPNLIRSRKETWLMLCTFDDLANRILPEARAALLHMADFREGDDLRSHPLRGAVLTWFADCLPRQSLLIFVDNFLVKGRKIFYRYALAILRRWYREFLSHQHSGTSTPTAPGNEEGGRAASATAATAEGVPLPEDIARSAHDAGTLADEAFAFSFSTKDIERSEKAAHVAAWNALTVSGLVSGVDEIAMTTTETPVQGFQASLQLQRDNDLPVEDSSDAQRPQHDSWHAMPLSTSSSLVVEDGSVDGSGSVSRTGTVSSSVFSRSSTMRSSMGGVMRRRRTGRSGGGGGGRSAGAGVRSSVSLRRIQQQMQSMFMMVYSELAQTQGDCGSLDGLKGYSIPRDAVTLQEQLGHGAFGQVHRGIIYASEADASLPTPLQRLLRGRDSVVVAVKSVLASAETEEQAKFLLEASLMVSLRHKHLVAMLGVCHTQLPYLLLLEFLENGNCRHYIRSCRKEGGPEELSPEKIRSVGVQIASALAYLHEHRIVHRDLAARNVLVGPSLALVKLADFGLSRALGDENYYRKTTQEKTPIKWQAPEATADGVYTPAGDIWSLGVFLWELSTYGQKPYQGMANLDAHYQVLQGYRLPPTELTDGSLYSIMSQCWSINPKQRPSSSYVRSMLEQAQVKSEAMPYSNVSFRRQPGRTSVFGPEDDSRAEHPYMQPVVHRGRTGTITSSNTQGQPQEQQQEQAGRRRTSAGGKHHEAAARARARTFQLLARVDRITPPAVPPRHSTMASNARSVQRQRLNSNRVQRQRRVRDSSSDDAVA